MLGEYSITLEKNVIGTAHVKRQGLYYLVDCRCNFPDDRMYRISVTWSNASLDLGICVPYGNTSGMNTRIPIKQAGEGTPVFCAILDTVSKSEVFFPLKNGEPAEYLCHLRKAHLDSRDGVLGLVLTDPA